MPQWRNKIDIKSSFVDHPTDEDVKIICKNLVTQLERIYNYEKNRKSGRLSDYFLDDFKNLIEEFNWIKESIEKGLDSEDYGFDDWTEAFNNWFGELYDMGDAITVNRDFFNSEKFMWVG